MAWWQLILYLSLLILLIGLVYRIHRIISLPVHLRWELYPVPHQKGKSHYGGSYFEDSNWWLKPASYSYSGEIGAMAREIFAIGTLFKNNRKLWLSSFPFHLGLYFLTAFAGFLIFGAIFRINNIDISAISYGIIPRSIYYLTLIFGGIGYILGALGAAGLLLGRIFRQDLRDYSSRVDYFNLVLLLLIFTTGIYSWISVDRSFDIVRSLIGKMIIFRAVSDAPLQEKIHLVTVALFLAYMPFTHMTHFVGKYFSFHSVRWQDNPSIPGGKTEQAIKKSLDGKIGWSASHIGRKQSWIESASGLGDKSKKADDK
jgi:nitrate reductase gamma subunit